MCGVMGFVRTGSATGKTWPMVKHTFEGIEVRGTDASGFSAIDGRAGHKAVVMKRPIKASVLSQDKNFKKVVSVGDIVIGHARFATNGDPKENRNNHPHWTKNGRYVLVHNGVIYDNPDKLKIKSECDSEIALLMVEKYGVREAFVRMSTWKSSSWAILVIDTTLTKVYACRNERNPMWIANMKREIGGYIIASTGQIIDRALADSQIKSTYWKPFEIKPYSLYEFTPGVSDIEPDRLPEFDKWTLREKNKPVYGYSYFHKGKWKNKAYQSKDVYGAWGAYGSYASHGYQNDFAD